MMLKLSEDTYFTIVAGQKQIRLIVFTNGQENVCRKTTKNHLHHFLSINELRLFKGRLQLWKKSTNIFVEVKGEMVGVLAVADFKNCLEKG